MLNATLCRHNAFYLPDYVVYWFYIVLSLQLQLFHHISFRYFWYFMIRRLYASMGYLFKTYIVFFLYIIWIVPVVLVPFLLFMVLPISVHDFLIVSSQLLSSARSWNTLFLSIIYFNIGDAWLILFGSCSCFPFA